MLESSIVAESHIEAEQRVRERAHDIYLRRQERGIEATPLDDWLAAEREILGDSPHLPAQERATTVGDAHKPTYTRGSIAAD